MHRSLLTQAALAFFIAIGFAGSPCPAQTPAAGPPPVVIPWFEKSYLVLEIEFASPQACANGCDIFQNAGAYPVWHDGRFALVYVAYTNGMSQLVLRQNLIKDFGDQIVWIDFAAISQTPPVPSPQVNTTAESNRALGDEVIQGGVGGLTGKGVIIAVIDTGIDFRHPDFVRDDNGKPASRLLYFWDTLSDAYVEGQRGSQVRPPINWPDGTPLGVVYTGQELTDEMNAKDPQVRMWDTAGHGTSCAGIAAGNGRGSNGKYAGVAPEADLIAVRIGSGDTLENAHLINAICAWIDDIATKANKPVVVSCSWSGQAGAHDGNTVRERQLNERFALNRAGRALCIAAGNDAQSQTHAELVFGNGKGGNLAWTAGSGCSLALYFDTNVAVQWTTPAQLAYGNPVSQYSGLGMDAQNSKSNVGVQFTTQAAGATKDLSANVSCYFNPLSKVPVLQVAIPPGPGSAQFSLAPNTAVSVHADAYIYGTGAAFTSPAFTKLIGQPGTTANAITVASYDWNDQFDWRGQVRAFTGVDQKQMVINALSSYSSPGPSRDPSAVKPEIAAPGQFFTAPRPRNISSLMQQDSSGLYCLFNGTSAATPYTAGVIALLLQKKPTLTGGDIKSLLRTKAAHDSMTGSQTPSPQWGFGRLNVAAVKGMLSAVDAANP
jgi:subtilisin family serine protease